MSYLLAGVIYPVEVLPTWLQRVSQVLPTTHALRALRDSGLRRAGLEEILPSLGALVLLGLILWPLAAAALAMARRHVERTGTLPHA